MKKIYFILVFFCTPFVCSAVQNDSVVVQEQGSENYDSLCKQELIIRDSLRKQRDMIQSQKVKIYNSLQQKKELGNSKVSEIEKLTKKLVDLPNQKNYIQYYQLKASTSQLQQQLDSLTQDTAKLYSQLVNLEKELVYKQKYIAELLALRQTISDSLSKQYLPYLESSIAMLTQQTLNEIKNKCGRFSDTEQVHQLLSEVEKLSVVLNEYTKACTQLQTKYDKSTINTLVLSLSKSYDLNLIQQQEIDSIRGLLTHYKDGVKVFQEYIKQLNHRREGRSNYSVNQFNSHHTTILEKLNIGNDIELYINPIPYLKNEFEKYINTLKKNPMQHPAIEKEILNIDFNE